MEAKLNANATVLAASTDRGMRWPLALGSALVFGIFTNLTLLYLALDSAPDPVLVTSPYEEGLHFGSEMDAVSRFQNAGFAFARQPGSALAYRLEQTDLKVPKNLVVQVDLKRPDNAKLDVRANLSVQDGLLSDPALIPKKGLWWVRMTFELNGEKYLFRENAIF